VRPSILKGLNIEKMNIISWNINGLRAVMKKGFLESISKLDPDILCLQEAKASESEIQKELLPLTKYHLYSNSAIKKGYSGTITLSKKEPIHFEASMGVEDHDKEGRLICTEFPEFYLINVYVPNSGQKLDRLDYRKKWDQDLLSYLKALEEKKPLLVLGDFNVAHQPIDLKNDKANYNKTAGYTQIEIDGMTNLLNSGFVDTFRHFHPNKIAYTFWSYRFKARERNTGWRIDYFLASEKLLSKIKSVEILSDYYGSDHCPIRLNIDL
jgi:exodeoxyribonuclease-3